MRTDPVTNDRGRPGNVNQSKNVVPSSQTLVMLRSALPASQAARRVLVGTLCSSFGRGLTLPFLLVYLTEVRGLSAGTVGLLVGWMGLVSLALAPVGGSLLDRFGARAVVLPLMLVASAGGVLLAFATGPRGAFAALTVIAIAFAALWSGQSTIMASLVTEAERQKAFGLQFTLINLGIGAGGLVAGTFVDVHRPHTFLVIYLCDAATNLIPFAILLSLRQVGRRLPGSPAAASSPSGGYAAVLRDRTFLRYFLFLLVVTICGYAQIEVGFTAFSVEVTQVAPRVLGWAFAGNTTLIVVAQLFVLRWLDGRSRSRALAVAAGLFAASWSVLAIAGLSFSGTALATVGVVACAVVFGMGETLLSPIMPAITNALATDELRGRYNALGSMVFGIASIVGPVTAGPLIGGGRAGFWIVLVVLGSLAAALLALNLRRHLSPDQDGRRPVAPTTGTATPEPAGRRNAQVAA
jgi:MFS family permease